MKQIYYFKKCVRTKETHPSDYYLKKNGFDFNRKYFYAFVPAKLSTSMLTRWDNKTFVRDTIQEELKQIFSSIIFLGDGHTGQIFYFTDDADEAHFLIWSSELMIDYEEYDI